MTSVNYRVIYELVRQLAINIWEMINSQCPKDQEMIDKLLSFLFCHTLLLTNARLTGRDNVILENKNICICPNQ